MNKIYTPIFSIIFALLLVSNVVVFYKYRNSQTAIKNDYFQKKISCEKLASPIKKQIDDSNNSRFAAELGGYSNFETIFYSPLEDSCIYVIHGLFQNKREYFIYNALTHNKITSFQFPSQFEEYKNFLREYSSGEIRL